MEEYVYFASAHGQDFTDNEIVCVKSSLSELQAFIEDNETDWTDGCYQYAILWRVPFGATCMATTEIIGVYDAQDCSYIDFSLSKANRGYEMKIEDKTIPIGGKSKIGPKLTAQYAANPMCRNEWE